MTEFYKVINGDYISGIGTNGNDSVTEITESEYSKILALINNRPSDSEGYTHKLRADNLEWEMVESPEPIDENAEISDYENALSDLGVKFGD